MTSHDHPAQAAPETPGGRRSHAVSVTSARPDPSEHHLEIR